MNFRNQNTRFSSSGGMSMSLNPSITLLFLLEKSSSIDQEERSRSEMNGFTSNTGNNASAAMSDMEFPLSISLSHKPLSVTHFYTYITAAGTSQERKKLYALAHESLVGKQSNIQQGIGSGRGLDSRNTKTSMNASNFSPRDIVEETRFQFLSKGQCIESTFSDLHLENEDNLKIENHYAIKLAQQAGYVLQKQNSYQFYHGKQESFDIRLAKIATNQYYLEIRYLPTSQILPNKFWNEVISNIVVEGWNVRGPDLKNAQGSMLIQQYYAFLPTKTTKSESDA